MKSKLEAKDLINIGLFTALYFIIGCAVAIPIGFVPILLPILGALWALITGIPFMIFLLTNIRLIKMDY
ncbi:MptD family putative ECF transporter S component [Clostridium estertheticum]|uniref:MptD family putative ECF transporter S component n=1 Tax=Clostridium estertheticum TaxID=238834 RepID=UPI00209B0434|nr:MptD family putative ECF transporter S component [Clostridium estertheticum]